MPKVRISLKNVFLTLSESNTEKARGLAGIPPVVLQTSAFLLNPCLGNIFVSAYPIESFLLAGNLLSYSCRPITLVSCLSKAFETILRKTKIKCLISDNLLSAR